MHVSSKFDNDWTELGKPGILKAFFGDFLGLIYGNLIF